MKVTVIRSIRIPFISTRAELANDWKLSLATIDARIKELKAHHERYGDFAVIDSEGVVRVNQLAFMDYMKYRTRLADKNLKKGVPDYEPVKIAKELGLYEEENY